MAKSKHKMLGAATHVDVVLALKATEAVHARAVRQLEQCDREIAGLRWQLFGDEAISIVDAAAILAGGEDEYLDVGDRRAAVRREHERVRRLMARGVFTVLIDPNEEHPRRKRKLIRSEVVAWAARAEVGDIVHALGDALAQEGK